MMGLPRSRTAWLARYLSYGGWWCGHEQLRYARSMEDVKAWLNTPLSGTSETALAPWWRLIPPQVKVVVIRRNPGEVLRSVQNLGWQFDGPTLWKTLLRLDAKLDQVVRRRPGVLEVAYGDLQLEDACAEVFEHCLPFEHDSNWWRLVSAINIQCDFNAVMRYAAANRAGMEKFAQVAKVETQRVMAARSAARAMAHGDLTCQRMSVDDMLTSGKTMLEQHSIESGLGPQGYLDKNIPSLRDLEANGKLVVLAAQTGSKWCGYFAVGLRATMETANTSTGVQLYYWADPAVRGVGVYLHQQMRLTLANMGVWDLFLKIGCGVPERISGLYRRRGATKDSEWWKLDLQGVG